MITELETAIKTKLEWISRFVKVYDHFTLKTEGYPYASFELSRFEWNFLDVCSNERNFTFNLVIIQNIHESLTRDQAKDIIYKCLEDVITNFDWDQDLWESNVIRWRVSTWEMGTIIEQEWTTLALSVEITLTVTTTANP